MNENLLGYLLDLLDPETRQAVDEYLAANPDAWRQLALLQRAIAPLAADSDDPNPPSHLVAQTLARLPRRQVRSSEPLILPLETGGSSGRRRWRRSDVVVAACIGFLVLVLIPPAVFYLQYRASVRRCAENLQNFSRAFQAYEQDHGHLPQPAVHGPRSAAGVFAPTLQDAGYWNSGMRVVCPANDRGGPRPIPTLAEMEARHQELRDDLPRYQQWCRRLGGCYGYNPGYALGNQFFPIRRCMGGEMPVLADRPLREDDPGEAAGGPRANSPNHGGRGQNVLFSGGHVRYLTIPFVGEDAIYRNLHGKVAVGLGPRDAALLPSETPTRLPPADE